MVHFKWFWHWSSALLMLLLFNSISTLVIAINSTPNNITSSNINTNNNNNNERAQKMHDNCPNGCHCSPAYVSCLLAGLRTVPRLPADTAHILLDMNKFQELPAHAFIGLPNLETLMINSANIYYLHPNALRGLNSLKVLQLHNNHISVLPRGLFQDLTNLEEIYLNDNEIWQLEPDTFDNLPNLRALNLVRNKISTLPVGVFNNLPRLKRLWLSNNPIACDCGIYAFWKYWKQMQQIQRPSVELLCNRPNELHNFEFNKLREQHFHCLRPVIVTSPTNVITQLGGTVELNCRMSGEPDPRIHWLHDDKEVMLEYANNYQFLPDGTLRVNNVNDNQVGSYVCVGSNALGETRTTAVRLSLREDSVDVSPQFTHFPTDKVLPLHALEDVKILMDCAAVGSPQPEIQWFFNSRPITKSSNDFLLYTNGTLQILRKTMEAAGLYRCEATNHMGSIEASAKVEVKELPVIIIAPYNKTVKLGKSFILECDADGNPMPTILWQFNDLPITSIPNNKEHFLLENENTELIVSEARIEDSGIYTCIAENEHGRTLATAFITVDKMHSAPRLIDEPFDIEAISGTTIELPCKALDNDGIKVTWRHDGRTINPNLLAQSAAEKYQITESGNLYVRNVTIQDGGRYECSIVNEYGRATASALVTIRNIVEVAPGDRYVRIAFTEAAREIDMAINNTVDMLFRNRTQSNTGGPPNFADLLRVFRFPKGEARQLARAAEIYERTLVNIRKHVLKGENLSMESDKYEFRDLLSREHLHLVAELSGCMEPREMPNCTDMCYHSKYRSIDGTCNNLKHPQWGSSLTAFRRIERPIYENGFSMPIGWTKNKLYAGHPKPSARLISTELITTTEITPDDTITHMVMQWGQFLDHDLDHAIPSVSSESWDGIDCKKTCEFAPPCFPVEVPPNDPRIKHRRCIDIVRSSSICGSGMTSVFFGAVQHREQINQLTSYIDASQVYGFSYEFAQELRNLTSEDGLLRVGVHFPQQKDMLPFAAPQDGMDCRRNLDENTMKCFVSGDIRVNEQVGLLAMHTMWMREHNRIALKFREINPHWDGDTIYQETRKIVGAQMQHITFKHWLPLILGESGMQMLGEYKGYDASINPTISNEFATVALRFGHTIINPILERLNSSYQPIPQGHLKLSKAFFAPWRLPYEGGVDPLMRGFFAVPAKLKTPDQNLNSELTEKLFQVAHAVALDLAAMNVQRGRDHGIPSYNVYRRFCNLSEAQTFEDLEPYISSAEVRRKLQKLYGHPDNIDVWVGAVLEDQLPGAKVGALLQCLLVEQFRRLRDGDRFYYENPSVFLPEQLQQIKQANLARVLCDNGDNLAEVTENVFILPQHQGGYKSCDEINGINLYFWQDCGTCSNNLPPLLSTYVPQTYPFANSRSKRHGVDNLDPLTATNDILNRYDINEERIGSLEGSVGSFQKELHRMHKKLRRLEDSLTSVNVKPKRSHCVDTKGTTRINNEVWTPDACTRCECRHAQINCYLTRCTELVCAAGEQQIKVPNECCAKCVDKNSVHNNNNSTILN